MFKNINLKELKKNLSFSGKKSTFNADKDIPKKQEKGVTAICKILQKRHYAYLADEVGMGKTYQAIGVVAMLFAEKKNAKVLIIAPNESVQKNWHNEIKNFFDNNINNLNLKIKDEDVRETHPVDIIKEHSIKQNGRKIDIVRLTSFSTIANKVAEEVSGYKRKGEYILSDKLYKGLEIVTALKKKYKPKETKYNYRDAGKIVGTIFRECKHSYDLIIIDEAQNIRNENNATTFLNSWLGLKRFKDDDNVDLKLLKKAPKINSKFLLLSATPAHRSIQSLRDQLLYFEKSDKIPDIDHIDHKYLEKFLIRRLRTYNNKNKYSVRKVLTPDVAENLDVKQKLFLALLQSKLAQIQANNNSIFKIGFLETFESYNASDNKKYTDDETGETKEFENGGSQKDDEKGKAPDKDMLEKIAKSYGNEFNCKTYPPHPKFDYMVKELTPDIENNLFDKTGNNMEKSIVFVRRLATVKELVDKRLNCIYEERIISYWGDKFGIKKAELEDIQKKFQKKYKELYGSNEDKDFDKDDIEKEINKDEEVLNSKFISWIAINKKEKGEEYNCVSLFKKSMMSNKTNSFIFDENYYKTVHNQESDDKYVNRVKKLVNDDFVKEVNQYINADYNRYIYKKGKYYYSDLLILFCYVALLRDNNKKSRSVASNIKRFYLIKDKSSKDAEIIDKEKIVERLLQKSLWNCIYKTAKPGILHSWLENSDEFNKREAVKSWIEKYLKSSEAILVLLYAFLENKGNNDEVCKEIWSELCNSELPLSHAARIRLILDEENANLVCKQVMGKIEIDYKSNDASFMYNQQWVMHATGGNKGNASLIKRFNTPFYPDIIVCTDVLKEGINLHLFCNKVYHYGLAWTPGDLEQRIGRVDRFFSKTHRAILHKKDSKINVVYPYMGKSIDEQQLRKVLSFKMLADPLFDSTGAKEITNDLDFSNMTIEKLANCISSDEEITNDPYSGEIFLEEKND